VLPGLSTAAKPAAACLSSRRRYGDPVTPVVLWHIKLAEVAVPGLGFGVCRVPGAARWRVWSSRPARSGRPRCVSS